MVFKLKSEVMEFKGHFFLQSYKEFSKIQLLLKIYLCRNIITFTLFQNIWCKIIKKDVCKIKGEENHEKITYFKYNNVIDSYWNGSGN